MSAAGVADRTGGAWWPSRYGPLDEIGSVNEIDSTDAMPPPDSIERPNEIDGVELGSIYRDRSPIDKADGDFLRLIRRPLWRGCQHE